MLSVEGDNLIQEPWLYTRQIAPYQAFCTAGEMVRFTRSVLNEGRELISGEQLRAARALAGWSQGKLAMEARVSRGVVDGYERGVRTPSRKNVEDLQAVLEREGVTFVFEADVLGVEKRWQRSSAGEAGGVETGDFESFRGTSKAEDRI